MGRVLADVASPDPQKRENLEFLDPVLEKNIPLSLSFLRPDEKIVTNHCRDWGCVRFCQRIALVLSVKFTRSVEWVVERGLCERPRIA